MTPAADVAVPRETRIAWHRDPLRDGYLLAAGVWVAAIAAGFVEPGVDAATFYAHRMPDPYSVTDYASGAGFYYSPPVALLFGAMSLFGLPVFAALMTGAGLAALYGILGRWAWLGLFFPPVWWDISAGNVNTVIGLVAVAGIVRPWLWSAALLTKVTPGIGVLWFAVRREWRPLAVAVGFTGALCLVSLIVAPWLWPQWIGSLTSNAGYLGPGYFTVDVPLWPRLIACVPLIAWGAATDRRWVLPIVVTVAMPVLWWSTFAALVGVYVSATRRSSGAAIEAGSLIPAGTVVRPRTSGPSR